MSNVCFIVVTYLAAPSQFTGMPLKLKEMYVEVYITKWFTTQDLNQTTKVTIPGHHTRKSSPLLLLCLITGLEKKLETIKIQTPAVGYVCLQKQNNCLTSLLRIVSTHQLNSQPIKRNGPTFFQQGKQPMSASR